MNILVTGPTGYIGGRLVPALLQKGHHVRVMARDPSRLAGHPWVDQVEVVQGDALAPTTLDGLCDGIEVLYYLIHSMSGGEAGFSDRDRRAASNIGGAAAAAGVQRIIYLGGLGNDEEESLSHHLASRHETGNTLRASGVPVTEFRAAIIVGSGSVSFEMIRYLTERLPMMITPRWVGVRCQPIAIRDVMAYLVGALEVPASTGRIVEIGGEDVMTYRDMMTGYAAARGLTRRLIPVPVLTPRLSSYWVNLVTPIPAAIARPLIDGLASEVVVRGTAAQELFPDIEPISYRQAVELALQRIDREDIETIWTGALSARSRANLEYYELESTEGMIIEQRQRTVALQPEQLFAAVEEIGGANGWYYADWAWRIRGFIDRLVGGPGLRRGRRHPERLRVGEALDFWRVERLERPKLLRLRAEMRLPGRAWLQFEVEPADAPGSSRLRQSAFFEPHGLWGLTYWVVLYPLHTLIFSGMSRAVADRALRRQQPLPDPPG